MTLVSNRSINVALIQQAHLHTLALWQTNPWLLLTNDKDVAFSSSKRVVNCVFDVNDIEASIVTFPMGDNTNTTHVATTRDHGNGTGVELDEVADLARCEINLHSVVDLDDRIWVSNPTFIHLISIVPLILFQPNIGPTSD